MIVKDRTDRALNPASGKRTPVKNTLPDERVASPAKTLHPRYFDPAAFLRNHAFTIVLFLISLFFIITITNPALYLNDEWITANQLHQLSTGHQVTFSEGKYGVTKEGMVSAYFVSRQNVLMYSLALPIAALPVVTLFGLLGNNFRLIVILIWSLCPVLVVLLIDAYYPAYARVRGVRILFPVIVLALFLFMFNILSYRQFVFSASDAPFEVAALVLTSHLLFALVVAVVFETCRLIVKDPWMALLGTGTTLACSSYIFWAGTAKDHMLTAAVFLCVIFFFILYLTYGRWQDALYSFFFSGLLIWVRPEVGFFVTAGTGLFFCVPLLRQAIQDEVPLSSSFKSCLPVAGVFIGGIPFFINNLLISHNWLIPAFDLPRPVTEAGTVTNASLLSSPVAASNLAGELNLFETLARAGDMIMYGMFKGFSFDTMIQGLSGVLIFPANGNTGFLILCPVILIALVAFLLWNRDIMAGIQDKRVIFFYLVLMILAAVFSYLPKVYAMNLSPGVLPDMRYLSPAYLPCGIISIWILSKTPFLPGPQELVMSGLKRAILFVPLLFLTMIIVHPFGSMSEGYFRFFECIILAVLLLILGLMVIHRLYRENTLFVLQAIPYLFVFLLIAVFTFQLVLVIVFGVLLKFNGYPLWIPVIENSFRVSIQAPA